MIIVGFIDGNRFRVVKENIEVSGLARPCRFVLISDLHNKVYGNKNDKIINYICEKIHYEIAYNVKKFTKNENAFMSTFGASRVEYSKEAVADEKIFIR